MALTLRSLTPGALDRMVAKVQAIATGKVSRVMMPRIAAGQVRGLAGESKAAQKSPQGRSWPKTKDKASLKWPAAATIRVDIVGGKVVAVISGPDWVKYQHGGWSKMTVVAPKATRHRHQHASSAADVRRIQREQAHREKRNAGGVRRWRGKARRILPKNTPPPPWKKQILAAINQGWRGFMHSASVKRAK